MKAEIITLTPELAKELLKKNIGNRDLKGIKNSYVSQMKSGAWKENGEPIIIDVNGVVKDGQHRLYAVIEANHTYKVPLISGVQTDVMDTIDTGTNRSLHDILKLNGFKHYQHKSTLIKAVLKYNQNMTHLNTNGVSRWLITNSKGLDFANKNAGFLHSLTQQSLSMFRQQRIKLLSATEISIYLYIIAKSFNIKQQHIDFMTKLILSNGNNEDSSTNYAYKKLLHAKISNTKMTSIYKSNLIIKCWNVFSTTDYPISRMVIKTNEYEKVNG
ncbi:MAG: hypothetical protein CMC55_05935 [Flavobacteriaceae bacterium]|nr:hypothetical protein [Flavobacteriaceae bacterium]